MLMPNSQMTRVKAASLVLKPIATKIIRAVPTMFCRICKEKKPTSLHIVLKEIHKQQSMDKFSRTDCHGTDDLSTFLNINSTKKQI